MDLYQLRYFLEVARETSFSRAARNLHISPPAVSKSVALLENSIGRKLFARDRRHVSLTSEGRFLKAEAERVFDMIERIQVEFKKKGKKSPAMLRIGSREMITNYLLGPSLKFFKSKHPETRFGLYELDPAGMADALKKDQIDFALYYYGNIPDPSLEIRQIGALPSHVYVAKSLLAGRPAPRTLRESCALPFIAPRYFKGDPAQPSLDGFPDQTHPRDIRYEAEFLETHRRYVLDGIAAAVLPDFIVKDEWRDGLLIRLEKPRLGREIYFIWRRGRALPEAVDEFVEILGRSIRRL